MTRSFEERIDDFCADGFLVVRGAVAPDVVLACVNTIEKELRERAVDPRDPATWTEPVVRFPCPEGPAFSVAGRSPALAEVYNALLGPGRWVQRDGVGGTLPVRFPSKRDPGDAGWHIDGSYDVEGKWWVNVHSRGRGLLALFLFTDVGGCTDGDPRRISPGRPARTRAVREPGRILRRRGRRPAGVNVPAPAGTRNRPRR